MKKLIAILMAALLALAGVGALAEGPAAIMTLSDVTMESMGQTIRLNDMVFSLALQNVNGLPSLAVLVDGEGKPLATAVGQLTLNRFLFAVDGMDHGYYADIPQEQAAQLAQVGEVGLSMLLPMLVPNLDQAVLPGFSGVELPKLDMSALLSGYAAGASGPSFDFSLDKDQVYALLDEILQAAAAQGQNAAEVAQAQAALAQLKASGKGVVLKGHVGDEGASQTVTADIYTVEGGVVASDPQATATLTSSVNNVYLDVKITYNGFKLSVATATLVSYPEAPRLDFNLNMIGGTGMNFSLYGEGEMTRATLGMQSAGQTASMELGYGREGGLDVVSFAADAAGQTMSLDVRTAMNGNGMRTGTLTLATGGNNAASITGNVTMYTGAELDMSGFTMPADLRPFEQMDNAALQEAFRPVMQFITQHGSLS